MSKNRDSSRSEPMRLQRYLAQCGVASRRKAEEIIASGVVRVNGEVVTELGTKVTPGKDRVEVDGVLLKAVEKGLLLFNKPKHVVSTLSDPEGRPSIGDYMTTHYRSYFPVGRLDWDSSGLMILTNDGDLADRLLHPSYELERVYEVEVEGFVSDEEANMLEVGLLLDDGRAKALRVDLHKRDDEHSLLTITIAEGRNRLVRRMMDKLDHPVIVLHRVGHGPFHLGTLRSGGMDRLTEREYLNFREKVMGVEKKKR